MSRSLDELIRRRKELGNIGALDFLIAVERKKFGITNVTSEAGARALSGHPFDASAELAIDTLVKNAKDYSPTLVKVLNDSLRLNKALTEEIKKLTTEKQRLIEKCETQEQIIEERFRELATLSRMLMNHKQDTVK